jgi:hypothetical protein
MIQETLHNTRTNDASSKTGRREGRKEGVHNVGAVLYISRLTYMDISTNKLQFFLSLNEVGKS